MGKLIFTALLAVFLLVPQSVLQAGENGQQKYLNGKPFGELNTRINELEARVMALEELDPPGSSDVVFSSFFTEGAAPGASILQTWSMFTRNATGSFSSIKIRNSFDGGASFFASAICSESEKPNQLAMALNTLDPDSPTITTLACGGLIWNIQFCSSGGVELSAGSSGSNTCGCAYEGLAIRPTITIGSWGGAGPDFGGPNGGTCNALSQTLEVILTR